VSTLLRNLLRFGRLLRTLGLPVPAGRMIDVAGALAYVDLARRNDFYFTLQALLVHRQQDLPIFDDAFRLFWRRPPGEWSPNDLRAIGEQRRIGPPEQAPPLANSGQQRTSSSRVETVERVAPLSYGNTTVSRTKDFAAFTDTELAHAKAMVAALEWTPGRRRTRRWAPASKGRIDLRRVVARSARYGGEPLALPTRARLLKRRPLVLLCDVSGSMERYSRILLHFAHSLSTNAGHTPSGIDRVEAFLFATRLTRITNGLVRRGADEAVRRILRELPDWGGGTRIGDSLRAFNVNWARRVRGRGPVVLLISDGWDRGDPEELGREMSRLRRSCHRLIWLNPLLGSPEYQPLTRGMQAALPFIDDFLPVHNLASLESLAQHLNTLSGRRRGAGVRRGV
jgi:uncharacterized protein with von Willebrand factor type A (vWA) domain